MTWHGVMSVSSSFTDVLKIAITPNLVEFMHDPLTVSYGFGDNVDTWLTMEEVDVIFWLNDHGIFETVDGDLWTDRSGYNETEEDMVSKTIQVARANNCPAYLEWYFNAVNNIPYDESNNESAGNGFAIYRYLLVSIVFVSILVVE